ncbi:hypothetical protein D4764_21G0003910 [Takifugu flavidus]|uniref:Uncharacterized protein n=1 Tax=Takifugu flavidus TaxID=433684 RepID=A0A5C6NFV5_9TELE|nr:hypothetical protein D4764_21G0003910 [Takifugu flavidus]
MHCGMLYFPSVWSSVPAGVKEDVVKVGEMFGRSDRFAVRHAAAAQGQRAGRVVVACWSEPVQRRGAARPVVVINDGDSVDLTHSITSGRTVQQLIYNTDTWQPRPPHPHLSTRPR